ncbi:MAG TPA: peptidoglycan-associated lipoprotein Pal, partial [Burkholderiaceae bacterium]|nr:peptidoglycan-associated lipoprotein Pal [Burkholderiaceae bacterium]
AATSGVAESRVAGVDLSAPGGSRGGASVEALPANQRVIYFDFDSFAVKEEYRPVVEFQARWLGADRRRRVLIEGHTDERGGREYNLALGQKRADAVLRALELLGAQESQMEAVSYGEERPAVAGSQEAAWAKNRRAELKDR